MYDHPRLGKYLYIHITIGISNSPDAFQQKINDLFCVFQFIHACIDYLMVLTKRYWIDHVQMLELTLNKLKEKST